MKKFGIYVLGCLSFLCWNANAQMADDVRNLKKTNTLSVKDADKAAREEAKRQERLSRFSLGEVAEYKVKSPFEGSDDQFAALAKIAEINQHLSWANQAHNLKQQLPGFKKAFESLANMKRLHQKALERMQMSEEAAIEYLGVYYDDPVRMWLGGGCDYTSGLNIRCASETFATNAYEKRGGFSGWLISAYKTVKAEKALDPDEMQSSMATSKRSEKTISASASEFDKVNKDEVKKDVEDNGSGYTKISDEVYYDAAFREQALLTWQVGSEAAKALGADMISATPKWAVAKNVYPIWNDEKAFYRQYLERKYINMAKYVRYMDPDLMNADMQDLLSEINDLWYKRAVTNFENLENPASVIYNMTMIQDVYAENKEAISAIADYAKEAAEAYNGKLKEEKNHQSIEAFNKLAEVYNKRASLQAELNQLERQKADMYDRIDTLGVDLDETKKEYNSNVNAVKTLESDKAAQESIKSVGKDIKGKVANYSAGFEAEAEYSAQAADTVAVEYQTKALLAGAQVELKKGMLESAKGGLSKLEQEIEDIKQQMANLSGAELEGLETFFEKQQDVEQEKNNIEYKKLDSYKKIMKNDLIEWFYESSVLPTQKRAAEVVQGAYEKEISNKDTGLYLKIFEPKSYEQITNFHQKVLNNLFDIGKNDFQLELKNEMDGDDKYSRYGGTVRASEFEEELYKVFSNSLKKKTEPYLQSDSEYFVGLPPKPRDFSAPRSISVTLLPPMREIVHFDMTDYESVTTNNKKKKEEGKQTYFMKEDFLNYGLEIPEIWKRILGQKGFVEQPVNLEDILEFPYNMEELTTDAGYGAVQGVERDFSNYNTDSAMEMYRGGMYPCVVNGMLIDRLGLGRSAMFTPGAANSLELGGAKEVFLNITGKNDRTYPYCTEIESVSGGVAQFYTGEKASEALKTNAPVKLMGSELGVFLGVDPKGANNGITFNDRFLDLVQASYKRDEKLEKCKKNCDDTIWDKINKNTFFTRNQFGNFLEFTETEQTYQQALDDLQPKVQEVRETLKTSFEKFGIKIADDIDLADQKTYDNLELQLEKKKLEYLGKATPLMSAIRSNNEFVDEKVRSVDNLYKSLITDSEELVQISNATKPDTELSSQIKQARADQEASGRYKEEANKAIEKQLKSFPMPYQAVYGEPMKRDAVKIPSVKMTIPSGFKNRVSLKDTEQADNKTSLTNHSQKGLTKEQMEALKEKLRERGLNGRRRKLQ